MKVGKYHIIGTRPKRLQKKHLDKKVLNFCTDDRKLGKIAISNGRTIKYITQKNKFLTRIVLIWECLKGYRYQGFKSIVKNVLLKRESELNKKEKYGLLDKIDAYNEKRTRKIEVVSLSEIAIALIKRGSKNKLRKDVKQDEMKMEEVRTLLKRNIRNRKNMGTIIKLFSEMSKMFPKQQ